MATSKLDALDELTSLADDDEFYVHDVSAGLSKKIKKSNLPGAGGGISNIVEDTTPQLGGNLDVNGFTVDGRDPSADGTKLDGIESGATADQSNAEIKTAYEANANTNAFTDAEQTKLSGIETSADVTDEANVTDALDGATLAAATLASDDKVLIQDTDGSDVLKTVTAQAVADLAPALTTEQVQDIAGGMWTGNTETGVTVTYQDADGTIDAVLDVAGLTDAGAFESGDKLIIEETGVGTRKIDYDDLPGAGGGLSNVIEDTTPQLGGALDVNSNQIVSVTGTDIELHSDNDVNIILGDAAGADDLNIKDSGGVTVAGVDSDGNITTSGTVDGRDVAADGTKLDGIETAATADQSAAEILTAIKTVDGTGSGLDADLLDGNEAAAFATAAQGTTADSALQDVVDDTTPQLGGDLDAQGNDISNPNIVDYSVESAGPSSASGTLTLDYTTGPDFDVTLDENVTTITLSNLPASGTLGKISLSLTQDGSGSHTVAFPAGWLWPSGSAPTMPAVAGDDLEIIIWTRDGGTTVKAADIGQEFATV